jgi:RNA polymerase sigma-70 factor, ECF subfamily
MAQELTAAVLLAGVAEHDEEKLGQLYDQYAPRLFGIISAIVADRAAAQEVLQELFLGLWKDARRLQSGRGDVQVWLMLEARARAVDRRRKDEGLHPAAHSFLKSLQRLGSWLPRPEEIARVDERRALLNKIVHRLPSSQNRLVELAILKGSTEAEMSEQLGQPPGRIEGELRAGLRFLRHRLRAVLGTWTADI